MIWVGSWFSSWKSVFKKQASIAVERWPFTRTAEVKPENKSQVEVYFYSLDLDGERHIRRMVKLSRLGEKRPIRLIIRRYYKILVQIVHQ